MSFLGILVSLVRPARLPTVWSNCLAGWWLSGGGRVELLPVLFAGATLIYLGAIFLHDVFDADYDRLYHASRPIPANTIAPHTVWRWGLVFLVLGSLLLLWTGPFPAGVALAIALVTVLGNATHRQLALGPVVDGLSRFFLYVLGASFGERGLNGWAIWCGIALACYSIGFGCFGRWKDSPHNARYWPVLLLFVPIGLALLMDVDTYRESGLLLSAVLGLWILRCLRQTFWSLEPDLRKTVNGLMAGIVFVDWLATCPPNFAGTSGAAAREISLAFLFLFGMTLLLQKFFPEK